VKPLNGVFRGLKNAAAHFSQTYQAWRRPRVRLEAVIERPRNPKRGRLYVTLQAGEPAFGTMLCPCGCGETLNLRFFGDRRPRWSIIWDQRKRPTVRPSIWRQAGCGSHFHLNAGRVDWC
jgi:hypothetical protein